MRKSSGANNMLKMAAARRKEQKLKAKLQTACNKPINPTGNKPGAILCQAGCPGGLFLSYTFFQAVILALSNHLKRSSSRCTRQIWQTTARLPRTLTPPSCNHWVTYFTNEGRFLYAIKR